MKATLYYIYIVIVTMISALNDNMFLLNTTNENNDNDHFEKISDRSDFQCFIAIWYPSSFSPLLRLQKNNNKTMIEFFFVIYPSTIIKFIENLTIVFYLLGKSYLSYVRRNLVAGVLSFLFTVDILHQRVHRRVFQRYHVVQDVLVLQIQRRTITSHDVLLQNRI